MAAVLMNDIASMKKFCISMAQSKPYLFLYERLLAAREGRYGSLDLLQCFVYLLLVPTKRTMAKVLVMFL